MRITHRLNAILERWLPEQRLLLKSDTSTRFIRLHPLTQLSALGGLFLVFGWTIMTGSILAIDALGERSAPDQANSSQLMFEERLAALAAERDTRASEALAAQERFSDAIEQMSRMQSQLLASETRRHELETGISIAQATLNGNRLAHGLGAVVADNGKAPAAQDRVEDVTVALDILSDELKLAAADRTRAQHESAEAQRVADALTLERDQILAHNDQILAQIEDAVSVSVAPLEDVFRKTGLNSDELLRTVRRGYSGTGGPLETAAVSSRGNANISQDQARAQEIMISLDRINTYRIAMDKVPLAMPVKSAFRFTSPYGARWGRQHHGIDFAAPVGTRIFATADGEVTFAGWQRGYGNIIKISHELGTETRYAHLSKIRVKVGQKVSRGALIGDMGNTGRSTGSHLHYEVRVNGRSVDPMSFIKAAQNVF